MTSRRDEMSRHPELIPREPERSRIPPVERDDQLQRIEDKLDDLSLTLADLRGRMSKFEEGRFSPKDIAEIMRSLMER